MGHEDLSLCYIMITYLRHFAHHGKGTTVDRFDRCILIPILICIFISPSAYMSFTFLQLCIFEELLD